MNRKYAWVGFLYFAQGWPAGLVNKALPIVFTAYGVDLGKIGLLSLANLPWTFKFLWAPIVDRFGARKHWMAACLVAMAALAALFGGALTGWNGEVGTWIWILVVGIAFFSATQDIAIDAGTIEMLTERELGTANGIRVTAYRVALIVAGGGLVILAAGWAGRFAGFGWPGVWFATGGLFLALAAGVLFFPEPPRERNVHPESIGTVVARTGGSILLPAAVATIAWFAVERFAAGVASLAIFLKYQAPLAVLCGVVTAGAAAWVGANASSAEEAAPGDSRIALRRLLGRSGFPALAAFILTFKLGDGAMAPMTTPFLLRGAGMTQAEVGVLLGVWGVGGTIVGAMLGGILTTRMGLFRALWILGLFQAFSNFGYAYAAVHPAPTVVWGAALFEAFCGGLGTAPFLAFLMRLCEKEHAATQYAFLSAIYVLSNALAGALSGYLAEGMGFGPYFAFTFFLAVPAFALLLPARRALEHESLSA